MRTPRGLLMALLSLAVLSACSSNSTAPATDSDGDGIPDATDPNPNGATFNRLNGTFTGGDAAVVEITWLDDAGAADPSGNYQSDLTADCSSDWYPQGTLCDEAPTTDSPGVSTKSTNTSGATWEGNGTTLGTGVLVIDACKTGGCAAVDVNQARVFQMFSDGKTTNIRFYAHASRSNTPPAWNDPGWQPLGPVHTVGAGEDLGVNTVSTVDQPTVVSLTPTASRYFRIDVQNDGTLGSPDYIELRSVKMFAPSLN